MTDSVDISKKLKNHKLIITDFYLIELVWRIKTGLDLVLNLQNNFS